MKGIFPFLAFVVVQPLLLSNNNKKRNAVLKTNLDSLCIQLDKCAAVHFKICRVKCLGLSSLSNSEFSKTKIVRFLMLLFAQHSKLEKTKLLDRPHELEALNTGN